MNRETAQQHGTTTVDKTTAPRSEQQHDSAEEESASSLTFDHWGYKHASRRHFAVRDLNLHIRAGERVLLLGASGIGKSTILEGAAGLIGGQTTPTTPPEDSDSADNDASQRAQTPVVIDADGGLTEGRVLIGERSIQESIGRVGLVLQDPDAQAIFQRLGDNVAFGPENLNVPRDRIWQRTRESLSAVGMDELKLTHSILHLSGGQMQRCALAGALAMRPGVLLLDEPTANLDPDGVHQIVGAVADVVKKRDCTMVLVEHRAGPWIDMIDRVVVLGLESDTAADRDAAYDDAAKTGSTNTDEGAARGLADDDLDRTAFRRTMIVADGTPEEVFTDEALDFAQLGIWVPDRFRRAGDVVTQMHTSDEPDYPAAEGEGEAVLSTRKLSIGRHNVPIATSIDLAFHPGQITALVGPNGVGKSTLSLTLAGLLKAVDGEVVASRELVNGLSSSNPFTWKSSDLASRISYVFQNPEHQFAKGTVMEEMMLAPLRSGMAPEQAQERANDLLERFNLRRYAKVNPYTLSGGEKRRLTVASALAAAPRVLLLDEPTFGQDRRTWMQIVKLIHSLRSDGVSIIVITHDRDLVTALGAKVVELSAEGSGASWNDAKSHAAVPAPQVMDAPPASSVNPHEAIPAEVPAISHVEVSPMDSRDEPERPSSRSPFLASLNPAYRVIGGLVATLPLLISLDWVSATVALALEFVLLMIAGIAPWHVIRSTWPLFIGAPGSAVAVLLYGKSGGDTLWQWGLILVTDRSVDLAIATALRILAIGIPAIVAVLGIDATDLADAFSQVLHFPDRFVYGGLAGMRLFTVLQDDWSALTASRRSRGLGDDSAVRTFFPQAFALLVLSIRRSTTLATAMQARGFGGSGPRSHARVSAYGVRDYCYLLIALSVPVIALISAGCLGTFTFFGG
ncbi:MAG: ATP-binding cassette domain-containing protein [Bifidobacterium crudilactis]|jgi:energy-coupling factor transport system permease/ATP-binding protein|uniref:ATP-binding cassette domain-containing protein n=1 Tax=Bifidobacterium crudilactis TaxID=327277 RepID=UPI003A5C29E2